VQKQTVDSPSITLRYRPQGSTIAEFHKRKNFVKGIIGPLGSAKTIGAINHILNAMHTQVPDADNVRRSRWCVARNSFPDLNSSTIPDFREISDRLPFGRFSMGSPAKWVVRYPRKDGTIVRGEVLFRSFDGIQDVRKARGMQLTGVWVDELGEFNKANFDMLIGRVKRYPPKGQVPDANFEVLFTSNAVPRDHWLAEMARNNPEGWWIGIQPPAVMKKGNRWVVNPGAENLQNLHETYYQDQIAGKKESWIRQNLANEFVYHGDGRPVHPDFNEQLHTADLMAVPGIPLYLGMDWGRTPACVILQRQVNGQWFVLDEVCLKNAGADKLGGAVKRLLNMDYSGYIISEATGDPSGDYGTQGSDDTPIEFFSINSEVEAFPAHTNDPAIRFATLDNLLTTLIEGQPALIVNKKCVNLISGLAGEYQFKRIQVAGEERFHDKPNKDPTSHICEALHYALMGAGESEVLFDSGYGDMMDSYGSEQLNDAVYE
jgi:hypothetical protein